MTALPQDNMPTLDEAALAGPGQRLAEARKAADLSIADVAARLHLDARTIEALESDEYEGLPAPAFVRGYLRGYARLLNLPADPIIGAYDRDGHAPPALVADIGRNSPSQAASSDLPVRLVTYLIAAGLVALVVVWWRNQSIDPFSALEASAGRSVPALMSPASPKAAGGAKAVPAPLTAPARASGSAGTVPAIRAGKAPVAGAQSPAPAGAAASTTGKQAAPPITTPASGQQASGTGTAVATAAPPSAVAGIPATSGAGDKAHQAAPAVSTSAKPAPPPAVSGTAKTATAKAATVTTPASAAAIGRLNLSFQHDSWVEVYSAKGDRLFFGMAHAGHQVSVQGQPPLQVLLGYARDIRVEYNGSLLNYEPFVSRGIARFTIEKDGTPEATAATSSSASSQ